MAAGKPLIPLRPDNFISPLTQDEQSALTWHVLSGCPKKTAFLLFARPDMLTSKAQAAIDSYVRQFYARPESIDYMKAYSDTLDAFLHPKAVTEEKRPIAERKAASKAKLMEFAMTMIDNIEQAKDPEFVLKMADKLSLLDGGEEKPEKPRRYLPVMCLQECRYRLFCEENTVDECQYCKYKRFSEENGLVLTPETQLDVAQDLKEEGEKDSEWKKN